MDQEHEPVFLRPVSKEPIQRVPSGLVPARTVLEGNEVRLEPLNPADHARSLYSASHGREEAEKVWEYLPFGPWPNLTEFERWLQDKAGSLDPIYYAIVASRSSSAGGMASFYHLQPSHGVIEIAGIWFSPSLQRTRPATEALYLMLRYAMDGLGYRRMQWMCDAANERSRRAARRLGFRFEGIFYNHMIVKGRNRDTAWYSILDYEWPDVRKNIESWLDDRNFDENGRALNSLSEAMLSR